MGDRKVILVLSGEIGTGKTTLSKMLSDRLGFKHCKTRERLQQHGDKKPKAKARNRAFFQKVGEGLDNKTKGKWVLDYFREVFENDFATHNYFVIDAARIHAQIDRIREAYSYFVVHIHLEASPRSLEKRFYDRRDNAELSKSEQKIKYQEYKSDPTEQQVNTLRDDADLVISTDRSNEEDVFIRVASFLRLLPPTQNELVDVIVGGQFGSEGKGQIAAHIAPEYDCLIRVGGPNAGHTVYAEPQKDVFHLLPSGTRRSPNAKLIIGPGAVLSLERILAEIREYGVEAERLVIDENAIVIREADIEEEKKISENISSTGQGVGLATANNIIARLHRDDKHKAKNYLKELRPFLGSATNLLEKMYREGKKILLEGTQGTGLSIHHGIYPFVTSRDTTVSGCLSEAGISPKRVRKIIMVTRTYPIRVGGTSGPFGSQEIDFKEIAKRSGKNANQLIKNEITTTTKKNRRIGEFSWHLFRKACELNSPTDIALTFTDYISTANESARRYDQLTPDTRQLIEEIERCSGVKVSLIGKTFDYRAIIDRRNWI